MAGKNNLIRDAMTEKIICVTGELAQTYGSSAVTVRKILQALGLSNRVFYNRFHNVGEVLEIVYEKTARQMRESMLVEYDETGDFFEYIIDCVANTLLASYEIKRQFNQYVFENDSLSQENYEWYVNRIKELFRYAKGKNLIDDVDEETLAYSIWCFCRGYNADAVSRMPKEEAVEKFKYSFRIILNGIKKDKEKIG